jgi:acetolactate synthase-1/2/3 large subunit
MEKISGAKAVVECLKKEGVEVIFGIPGGANMPIYDELFSSDIRHILARHEQGAVHMAEGYARASGKVGVCMATSGPGATNLITGIADAYMDSVPLICITGQVPTQFVGTDAFQETDVVGITTPITKHNYLVKNIQDLPRVFKDAFHIATTGRPGPVVIDLPKDVLNDRFEFYYPENVHLRGYKPTYRGHPLMVKKAAELIMRAESPVIVAGGGVIISGATEELITLAEMTMTPVATTLMGKGAIPENHPLSLGMVGMHGSKYANYAVMEADLIIAVGVRFTDRTTGRYETWAPNAKKIHIDIDPAEIGKNIEVDVPIVGDAKSVLRDIIKRLSPKINKEWVERVNQLKQSYPFTFEDSEDEIKPQYVIKKLNEIVPDAIVTTEVGQNQMWSAMFWRALKPRTFITSGGLAAMGFGFPAALGAKVARPEEVVIDIAGDGSFVMTCQELATSITEDIPIIVAILNNGYLGMVRQWQQIFHEGRYSEVDLGGVPDFVKLAEAYGAEGIRVTRKEDVEDAIKEALKNDVTTVIDFVVSREENVLPMVPPGMPITQILDEKSIKPVRGKVRPKPGVRKREGERRMEIEEREEGAEVMEE